MSDDDRTQRESRTERAQDAQDAHNDAAVRTVPDDLLPDEGNPTDLVDFLGGFGGALLAIGGARILGIPLATRVLVLFGSVLFTGALLFNIAMGRSMGDGGGP